MIQKDKTYIINCGYDRTNYGAVLTAFALQYTLKNLFNIDSYNIDITPSLNKALGVKNYGFDLFKSKFMNFTEQISNLKQLYELNNSAKTYITGSDQVFRIPFVNGINNGYEQFFLDFADIHTKKISVSASFGITKEKFLEETDEKTLEKIRHSLLTFDSISVREKTGVEICKDLFDIDAKWIIDPVFWIDKDDYEKIASDSLKDYSDKIVSYFFHKGENYSKQFAEISKKYGSQIIQLHQSDLPIEDWLKAIKTCKLFITNSFHGMCFAILFNKPFICMINSYSGNARNVSVLEKLEIEDNLITSFEEIYQKDCIFKYNFELVNENIKICKKEAIDFLQKAFAAEHEVSEEKAEHYLWLAKNKIIEQEETLTIKNLINRLIWRKWLQIYHYYLPVFLKKIISLIYMHIKKEK